MGGEAGPWVAQRKRASAWRTPFKGESLPEPHVLTGGLLGVARLERLVRRRRQERWAKRQRETSHACKCLRCHCHCHCRRWPARHAFYDQT
jgi:hypothetical protein